MLKHLSTKGWTGIAPNGGVKGRGHAVTRFAFAARYSKALEGHWLMPFCMAMR